MHNRITKLAIAAVVIVAAILSINLIDRSMPAAFGIEQVIAAYENIRFIHVKQYRSNREKPNEFWIKSNEQGQVTKARYYLPVTEDGVKLITWTPERAEIWFKTKQSFLICQAKDVEGWMQSILQQCQPKTVMKKLLEDQEAGKVDVDIQKPQQKREPAVIVATYKTEPKKEIYYINQATDLITHIEFYHIEENKEMLSLTTEFYDYNVPIDEKMFSLKDEIPDDIKIADQLTQLTGVAQADMNDTQAAEETVRQFFQALIDKDYKKAGLITCGMLEEYAQKEYGQINITRIVSIGPAVPQPDWVEHGFRVPCELETIDSEGQKTIYKSGPYVRPGDDERHPYRWHITGGMGVVEVLPDNEKYENMTVKQAAEAFFKACAEKDWDEFLKFWPMPDADEQTERMKEFLGGLEVISIGEPFKKDDYPGWYVPYEIKLPPKEVYLQLSDENASQRFVITGYCDVKMENCSQVDWTREPEVLPNNDAYANMSADVAVEAFNNALAQQDFNEMQKLAPSSFVEMLKTESEEATKLGVIKKGKSLLEVAGEAFWSPEHSAYLVKLRMIGVKAWNLAIRNDNAAKRYMFDGGI